MTASTARWASSATSSTTAAPVRSASRMSPVYGRTPASGTPASRHADRTEPLDDTIGQIVERLEVTAGELEDVLAHHEDVASQREPSETT